MSRLQWFLVPVFFLMSVSPVFAAMTLKARGVSLLVWLFVGFIAMFIASQIVPGLLHCLALLRNLFKGKRLV